MTYLVEKIEKIVRKLCVSGTFSAWIWIHHQDIDFLIQTIEVSATSSSVKKAKAETTTVAFFLTTNTYFLTTIYSLRTSLYFLVVKKNYIVSSKQMLPECCDLASISLASSLGRPLTDDVRSANHGTPFGLASALLLLIALCAQLLVTTFSFTIKYMDFNCKLVIQSRKFISSAQTVYTLE